MLAMLAAIFEWQPAHTARDVLDPGRTFRKAGKRHARIRAAGTCVRGERWPDMQISTQRREEREAGPKPPQMDAFRASPSDNGGQLGRALCFRSGRVAGSQRPVPA